MKRLTIILLGVMLSISINAQWYQSYGVTDINDLTQPQCNLALEKADKTIQTGKILTFGGVAVSVIGIVIYSSAINDIYSSSDTNFDEELNKGTAGAVLMYGGMVAGGIGIPLWISGATRKSQIEIAVMKFGGCSYVPTVGFNITF